MYVCNTGLECEDCIGGCEKNLEWEDDSELILMDLFSQNSKNNTSKKDEHK